MVGKFSPAPFAMRFEIETEQRPWMIVEAAALIRRNERASVPSLFNQMFASCNVTRRAANSDRMEVVSVNKIFVRKDQESDSLLDEFYGLINSEVSCHSFHCQYFNSFA